jgi:hypothetical protein
MKNWEKRSSVSSVEFVGSSSSTVLCHSELSFCPGSQSPYSSPLFAFPFLSIILLLYKHTQPALIFLLILIPGESTVYLQGHGGQQDCKYLEISMVLVMQEYPGHTRECGGVWVSVHDWAGFVFNPYVYGHASVCLCSVSKTS